MIYPKPHGLHKNIWTALLTELIGQVNQKEITCYFSNRSPTQQRAGNNNNNNHNDKNYDYNYNYNNIITEAQSSMGIAGSPYNSFRCFPFFNLIPTYTTLSNYFIFFVAEAKKNRNSYTYPRIHTQPIHNTTSLTTCTYPHYFTTIHNQQNRSLSFSPFFFEMNERENNGRED